MNPELFWSASIEELKKGYIEENQYYVCLLCGETTEKGRIYSSEGNLFDAERYMNIHIHEDHQSVFEHLINFDKKLTGLTEHQNHLLRLFYQGASDKEIQSELGIGSASTIRNHRYVLKEKERQAKLFLTLMELLKEKDTHAPSFVPVHTTATMVDDRYNITEDEQQKILMKYLSKGKLSNFPPKEKQRLIVLRAIVKCFAEDRIYNEKEVNSILSRIFDDYVKLRRYLVEYGFLDRKADGSQYWLRN